MDPRTVELNRDLAEIQDFTRRVNSFQHHLQLLQQMDLPLAELEGEAGVLVYRAMYIHHLIVVRRGAQLRRLARMNRPVAVVLRLAMQAQEEYRDIMLEHFVPPA